MQHNIHASFDQFQLKKYPKSNLNLIKHSQQTKKDKVNALLIAATRRNHLDLYKGIKHYYQDLQFILNQFPELAPFQMKSQHIQISKDNKTVLIQCHNCASYTGPYKYCQNCQNVHYCQEGCYMKVKFSHERQQCKPRPLPKKDKCVQVQVHFGCDLGQNVSVYFQHQMRMSLIARGQNLIKNMQKYFSETQTGSLSVGYKIQTEIRSLHFENDIKDYQTTNDKLNVETIDQISQIYEQNQVLKMLEIYLLKNGAILNKYVKQIHDNHIHFVYIFNFPCLLC